MFLFLLFILVQISASSEIEKLILYALENSPRIKVYENLKRSVKHRESYSKNLPNPSLVVGLNNLPLNRPYPSKLEPMSSLSFGIAQMYVLPIKREKEADVSIAEFLLLSSREELLKRELIRDIRLKYLEWLYTFKEEEILKSILKEIRSLEKITEENYRFGKATLSDLLSIKAEVIRVEREIRALQEERRLMKEELYYLIGGSVELKGEDFKVQDVDLESLKPELSPYLKVLKDEMERVLKEVERAKVEYLPDFEFMAEYMIRPGLDNMFSLRLSMSLPIRRSRREDLMVLEKLEELRAKEKELENMILEVRRSINSLKVEKSKNLELMGLTKSLLEERERELKAMEAYYRFGRVDFRDLLRLQRELWELRMELLRLELELKKINLRAEVFL
ncbi:MAG: TolC family protein [Acidobacteria bacterium]|nr:MAG: TolC family protein [Acidobacteriota bacterium]